MKNHNVVPTSSSILLALLALEDQHGGNKDRQNEELSIPLGSLYNRVSNDNDQGWIELPYFNTSIENLAEAGLISINTPKATETTTGTSGNVAARQNHETHFTVQTALRTVALTTAGRAIAEQHPEWSTNEVPEHAMTAAGGSGGNRR